MLPPIAVLFFIIGLPAAIVGWGDAARAAMVLGLTAAAFEATRRPATRRLAFTAWVLAFFGAALAYPWAFRSIGTFRSEAVIVPLIQLIMFGMGATLSLNDFARIRHIPGTVLLGMILQFSIMPLLGVGLATLAGLPAEVAAGVVLIGSCPGGVASNVMVYLSGGHVALSVTLTACSTLLSPLATPWLMQTLAGRWVALDPVAMMLSILNMVLLPVVAGLLVHHLLRSDWPERIWRPTAAALGIAALGISFLFPGAISHLVGGGAALLLASVLRTSALDRLLPWVSMAGICLIIAVITAGSRDLILSSGLVLLAVAVAHNTLGYLGGYYGARLFGYHPAIARTLAFEVGMQNGGLGAALAVNTLQSQAAAVAPVLFGVCMNLSGSLLATFWRTRPPPPTP